MEFLGHAINDEHILERALSYGMDLYYLGPAGMTPISSAAELGRVHTMGYWNFLLTRGRRRDLSALGARVGVPVTSNATNPVRAITGQAIPKADSGRVGSQEPDPANSSLTNVFGTEVAAVRIVLPRR